MNTTIVSRRGRGVASVLAFLALVSCGGGGGGSSTPPTPESKVFFADGGNGAIVSFSTAAPTASFPIDRVIQGPATLLPTSGILAIPSLTLDAANNRLYVATQGNTLVFNNISMADGNVAPTFFMSATINTVGPGLRSVNFMHNDLNRSNGTLYSVDIFGEVHVFSNPVTAPSVVSRIITPDLGATTIAGTFGLALDAGKDMLYVGAVFNGTGSSNIIVFNNASAIGTAPLTGPGFPPPATTVTPVAPTRTLSFAQPVVSFHLDTVNDHLYTAHSDGIVRVFHGASTLPTGTPIVDRTIDLGGSTPIDTYIFVDTSRNKLYAVASNTLTASGALGIIDNASTANEPTTTGNFFSFSNIANIALSAIVVKP
ncbi:MAG TPA: hypothetical protein VJO54_04535 [Burkholderiales bacterium]|nr:hypothetical protein [Burkholderiales bacterium]